MPSYLPLPDGTYLQLAEGETAAAGWLRAQQKYPEAFLPRKPELAPETGGVATLDKGAAGLPMNETTTVLGIPRVDVGVAFANAAVGLSLGLAMGLAVFFAIRPWNRRKGGIARARTWAAWTALLVCMKYLGPAVLASDYQALYTFGQMFVVLVPIAFLLGWVSFGLIPARRVPDSSATHVEDAHFAQAAEELAGGARDAGLWARLYAEADGDENKARARYIRLRAESLASESRKVSLQSGHKV